MKRTQTLIQVVREFMRDPDGRHWGYDLSTRSGVRSGSLYPLLRRMLEDGWLSDGWEDPSKIQDGRPPRRYYVLTSEGRGRAVRVLGEVTTGDRIVIDPSGYRVHADRSIEPPVAILLCDRCSGAQHHEVDQWEDYSPSLHELAQAARRHEMKKHQGAGSGEG